MEITVTRDALAAAVTWAARLLPARPVLPVLSGIRLDAVAGFLTVSVFDYEAGARVDVPGVDAVNGSILAEGRGLLAAIKSLPKAKGAWVELTSQDDGTLAIECEGALTTVGTLPLGEYPPLPDLPRLAGTADAEAFKRAVTRVQPAASKDDTLPTLTGIAMHAEPGTLTMVTTDRYRLAVYPLDWTICPPELPVRPCVVPAKALLEFAKNCTGKVVVYFGDDAIDSNGFAAFSDDTRTLTTRTIGGEFPRYRLLLDRNTSSSSQWTVTADATALTVALKTCGELSDKAIIRLSVRGGQVTVCGLRDNVIAATRTVPAVIEGGELDVKFDATYLASMIAGIKGTAVIGLNGPGKPAHVTSSEPGDPFTAIVVPIRPDEEK
jgi:DNA polymerase-3 subunit beta